MDVTQLIIDLRQLRVEARQGRVSVEHLLDLIDRQQQTIRRLQADRKRLRERLARYESEKPPETTATTGKANAPYSVEAEIQRRQGRKRHKKSPGRTPTEEKFSEAERIETIYPDGIPHRQCHLVRERAVWRIEEGKAVRMGYRIFAGPDHKEPRIPGVTLRCEYGIEVLVVLAYLVYLVGISLDKACQVLSFFCQLSLTKSQADALLRQLAQHWEAEFNLLCDLLAEAAIVAMDETSWKVGNETVSLWAFASQLHRVFLFGCRKDEATLNSILPLGIFTGIGVSDDAKVYSGRFVRGQKCWGHLLRKAIKLAISDPNQEKYRVFLDGLVELYRDAQRAASDGRLGESGRRQCVTEFERRLAILAEPHLNEDASAPSTPDEHDFVNLVNELVRIARDEELFTFVLVPEVESTNNAMERELRGSALDRKAGRTNKTGTGAHRRSVIESVLRSLGASLPDFSLETVLEEVTRWMKEGLSLFAKQHKATQATPLLNTG